MRVKLKDLAIGKLEYGSGAAASMYDGDARYVRITDIDDNGQLGTDIVSPSYYEEKHLLNDGDLLFARTGATVGKTLLYKERMGKCVYAGFLIRLIPDKTRVLPDYVYYFTKSPQYDIFVAENMKVVAQPNINAKQYGDLELDVPSLEEQQTIVEKLDKVSGLIAMRKKQLQKLDDLVKARFVEMFGDPESNPCGWPVKKLDVVVASITAGWSANGEARPRKAGEKAVLKVSAVTQGFFKPDEHKVIPADMEIKKYVYPQKGDLLFSRANTRELVGATAIIEQDYPELLLSDKLWKVLFTNEMDVYYAKHILSTQAIRKVFSSQSTGTSGSMYNVSADKFRETLIPVPPMMLQREFASFVQQTDKSKLTIQQSLDKLELMKKALMQKYFG